MHRLKLNIMFATIGQLAAKILVIVGIPISFFRDFFLFFLMFI